MTHEAITIAAPLLIAIAKAALPGILRAAAAVIESRWAAKR